jgi:hypothetical protein
MVGRYPMLSSSDGWASEGLVHRLVGDSGA